MVTIKKKPTVLKKWLALYINGHIEKKQQSAEKTIGALY